jgi:hypothetical protein
MAIKFSQIAVKYSKVAKNKTKKNCHDTIPSPSKVCMSKLAFLVWKYTVWQPCVQLEQGYQMVYFQTRNSKLGKFWRVLQGKMLVYRYIGIMAIWYMLLPFGIFYCHLVYFVATWGILWLFGIFFPFWYVLQSKIWQPWTREPTFCTCFQSSRLEIW